MYPPVSSRSPVVHGCRSSAGGGPGAPAQPGRVRQHAGQLDVALVGLLQGDRQLLVVRRPHAVYPDT